MLDRIPRIPFFGTATTPLKKTGRLNANDQLASDVLDYSREPGFGDEVFQYNTGGRKLEVQIIKSSTAEGRPVNPTLVIYDTEPRAYNHRTRRLDDRSRVSDLIELPVFDSTGKINISIEELSAKLQEHIQSFLAPIKTVAIPQVASEINPDRTHLTEALHLIPDPTEQKTAHVLADEAA